MIYQLVETIMQHITSNQTTLICFLRIAIRETNSLCWYWFVLRKLWFTFEMTIRGWFSSPKSSDRFEMQWKRIQNLIYQVCDHTWLDLQKWKLHISMVLQRSWQIFQIQISSTNKSLWQKFISKWGLSSSSCVSFHKSQHI